MRAKAAATRRGKLEGGFIMIVLGAALGLFLYYLAPGGALWMIGLMPSLIGVVLAVSTWLEQPKGGTMMRLLLAASAMTARRGGWPLRCSRSRR